MTGKYVISDIVMGGGTPAKTITANVTGPDGVTREILATLSYAQYPLDMTLRLEVRRIREQLIFGYLRQAQKEADEWRRSDEIKAIAGDVQLDKIPNGWLDELSKKGDRWPR